MLGEPNHFIHEKVDFRLWWLGRLARRYPLVLLEELGWADGRRIARFLADGDDTHIRHAATFGYEGWKRDDSPTGVFAPGNSTYPNAQMCAEHTRFYRSLRDLGIRDYFGFDIDPGGGIAYENLEGAGFGHVTRVPSEALDDEAVRIRRLGTQRALAPVSADLSALADSLRYTSLVRAAADYEATRPAMAFREDAMKRRESALIDEAPAGARVVLMAHAFHLVKDDAAISFPGVVGPGGDRVSSLGHYLATERRMPTTAVWMLYSAERDCQPLNDLPREANCPQHDAGIPPQAHSPDRRLPTRLGEHRPHVQRGRRCGAPSAG